MNILIDDRQNKVEIDEAIVESMEKAIVEVLEYEKEPLDFEVSLSFVTNEEIHELNKEYRNVDSETDVLSFPVDQDFLFEGGPNLLGDVIISIEKAVEQAREYGHSFEREMVYLTVHSIFHLLGYDHMNEDEKQIMRKKEEDIMTILDINR